MNQNTEPPTAPGEQIAPEHNPDQLTVAQVGEGWRLLDEDEIPNGDLYGEFTCIAWLKGCKQWSPQRYRGEDLALTYATSLSRAELRAARRLEPETWIPAREISDEVIAPARNAESAEERAAQLIREWKPFFGSDDTTVIAMAIADAIEAHTAAKDARIATAQAEIDELHNVILAAIPSMRLLLRSEYPGCTDEQIGLDEWWWPAMVRLGASLNTPATDPREDAATEGGAK